MSKYTGYKEYHKNAQKKYDADNIKFVGCKFHIKNDADILELLEQSNNKQGLIKEALREYIENHQ